MCPKASTSELNLIHGTKQKIIMEIEKQKKIVRQKSDIIVGPGRSPVDQSGKRKKISGGNDLRKR